MNIEAILISGVSAFLGTLGAISFQYWRENNQYHNKGNALISQLISLTQHNRLILEVFDENHELFTGSGHFQIPSPPPTSIISPALITDVAEHINKQDFEVFSTTVSGYESFYAHTNEMRNYNFEIEKRILETKATSATKTELERLSQYSKNFKSILKTNIASYIQVQDILDNEHKKRTSIIFDHNRALKNWPAVLLLYIVVVSYLVIIFGHLYFAG